MQYNLYSRVVGGKTRWYYEFYDQTGTRVRKSTGCKKKSEATAFVQKLEYEADQKERNKNRMRFKSYAAGFFMSGPILSRWKAHGKTLKRSTLAAHQSYIDKYLIPWFGERYLGDITAKELDASLMVAKMCGNHTGAKTRELSGSAKNSIKNTLTILLKEAHFDGHIDAVPPFKVYARNSKHQSTLSDKELTALFPFDPKESEAIWSCESDQRDPKVGRMFATMSAVSVSCGLRSGEVIALSLEQIIPGKGLVIDRVLDDDGRIALPKKGTENDPRFRVVPLSDYTLILLEQWLAIRGDDPGLLFTYRGHQITGEYLLVRFKRALAAAKINTTGRRITFHGLRYTYNTKMKNVIPHDILRDIIGHRSEEMTDLYDRPVMEERLDEYRKKIMPAVNGFWKAQ